MADLTETLAAMRKRIPYEPGGNLVNDAKHLLRGVENVLKLHTPQVYYHHPRFEDDEGEWFKSVEGLHDAYERSIEWNELPPWDACQVESKTYCEHCESMVVSANEPWEAPFAPLAVWPCPTVEALTDALGADHEPSNSGSEDA